MTKQPEAGPHTEQLRALFVGNHSRFQQWLQQLLQGGGFTVTVREREVDGASVAPAPDAGPDLVVVGADGADPEPLALCRALREDPAVGSGTPIIVALAGPPTRAQRMGVLRAGAWECVGPPADGEELLLRWTAFANAKATTDRSRGEPLVDLTTGWYSRQGLARRAHELAQQAFRQHAPLACVVFAFEAPAAAGAHQDPALPVLRGCARALNDDGRGSDVVGRLGPGEVAILAPATDADGALILARRLGESLEGAARAAEPKADVRLRAGYDAVANVGYAPTDPVALILRAATAARQGTDATRIRRFGVGAFTRLSRRV
jgi:PleD family two-component response regulator